MPLALGIGLSIPLYRNPLGVGPPPYDPIALGVSLWLDAAGLTDSDGTSLAVFPDLSGNGIDFDVAGTDAANLRVRTNVQNGLRIVRSPGGDVAMVGTGFNLGNVITNAACTLFAVSKITTNDLPIAGGGSQDRALFTDSGGYFSFGGYNNAPEVGGRNFSGSNDIANAVADTNFHVWQMRHDAGNLFFEQDEEGEASIPSGNTDSMDGVLQLFASYVGTKFIGDLGELLVFPTVLSAPNRLATFNYLKNKWATP